MFQAMVELACFVSILKKGLQNRKVLRLIGSKNENGLVVETTSDAKAQSLHLLLKWAQKCANVMKTTILSTKYCDSLLGAYKLDEYVEP
jgi:phage terminase large subunit